jgi:hypothetical protein
VVELGWGTLNFNNIKRFNENAAQNYINVIDPILTSSPASSIFLIKQPVPGGNHNGITADVEKKVNFTVEHIHHMTLKKTTLKFGNKRADESRIKEMKQMVDMEVMTPIMPNVARAKMKGGFKFTRTFKFYKDKYNNEVFEKLKRRFVNMEFKNSSHNKSTDSPTACKEFINVVILEAAQEKRFIGECIANILVKIKPDWENSERRMASYMPRRTKLYMGVQMRWSSGTEIYQLPYHHWASRRTFMISVFKI